MRQEIVYVSLGGAANHIATHFWNAQQSYFDYASPDDALEAPLVDHDVSFKAGIGTDGHDTYSPRALLFDARAEFGSMRRLNPFYGGAEEDAALAAWDADTLATQERVSPSWYAEQLEREDQGSGQAATHPPHPAGADSGEIAPSRPRFRYWSDYARVFYHPRSSVPVSAPGLHGTTFLSPFDLSAPDMRTGDARPQLDTYEHGFAVAQAMEHEQQVLDEQLRWFAEDSDQLQGLAFTSNACDGFAGLTGAYLGWIADEYPKASRVLLSVGRRVPPVHRDSRLGRVLAMNQVLSLARHMEHVSLLVPASLDAWRTSEHVCADPDDLHATSAVLSTHWETATLGTRLRSRPEPLDALASRLNWRRDTPFAQLAGCLPTPLLAPVRSAPSVEDALIEHLLAGRHRGRSGDHRRMHPEMERAENARRAAQSLGDAWCDYSLGYGDAYRKKARGAGGRGAPPYAESFVARDADRMAEEPTCDALSTLNEARPPLAHRSFAPLAYPVLSSYPTVFRGVTRDGRPRRALDPTPGAAAPAHPASVPVVSSLSTSPATLETLRDARRFVARILERREPLAAYGIGSAPASSGRAATDESEGCIGGRDGLVELRETLEQCCDAYGGEPEDAVEPGTDEEWGDEVGDAEWDL